MTIAILSDTHVPEQASAIPDAFRERVREADVVVHAGDFGSMEALADVQEIASDLTAVYGNADPNDIDLPPVASVEVDGVTFVATHGMVNHVERAVFSSGGLVTNRETWIAAIADTARARAGETAVGIGGHSHEVEDTVHEGVRLLNPGSATAAGPADAATMMTAEVDDGDVSVTVHEA